MQLHIRTKKDTVTVYADVTKIEVEDVVGPGEDSLDESYTRTIRFTGAKGRQSKCSARLSRNRRYGSTGSGN